MTVTATIESYPNAITKGTMTIENGMTSSAIPKVAPPNEKAKNNNGNAKRSNPRVLLINAKIPASIAPVCMIIPNAPPTTKISAAIPTADPYLSPETNPSKTKFKKPKPLKSSVPQTLAVLCSFSEVS